MTRKDSANRLIFFALLQFHTHTVL